MTESNRTISNKSRRNLSKRHGRELIAESELGKSLSTEKTEVAEKVLDIFLEDSSHGKVSMGPVFVERLLQHYDLMPDRYAKDLCPAHTGDMLKQMEITDDVRATGRPAVGFRTVTLAKPESVTFSEEDVAAASFTDHSGASHEHMAKCEGKSGSCRHRDALGEFVTLPSFYSERHYLLEALGRKAPAVAQGQRGGQASGGGSTGAASGTAEAAPPDACHLYEAFFCYQAGLDDHEHETVLSAITAVLKQRALLPLHHLVFETKDHCRLAAVLFSGVLQEFQTLEADIIEAMLKVVQLPASLAASSTMASDLLRGPSGVLLEEIDHRDSLGEGERMVLVDAMTHHSAGEPPMSPMMLSFDNATPVLITQKLAMGSYGILYKGTYGAREVAVKVLRKEVAKEEMGPFRAEAALMQELKHPHVLEFIGAVLKPPRMFLVTEYVGGGSVYDVIHKQHKRITLPALLQIALDTARGMAYMNANGIMHRDLKTGNLLITEGKVTKIADFGFARHLAEAEVMTAEVGSYLWMAPEVIEHKPYGFKADVFSFGIAVWEMLTGELPYASMPIIEAAVAVARKGLRPPIPPKTPKCLVELLQACWQQEPDKRPDFTTVVAMLEKARLETVPLPEGVNAQTMTPQQVDDAYRAELTRPTGAMGWLKSFTRHRRPSDVTAMVESEGKPPAPVRFSLDERRLSAGQGQGADGAGNGKLSEQSALLAPVLQEQSLEDSHAVPQGSDKAAAMDEESTPCFCFGRRKMAARSSRAAK